MNSAPRPIAKPSHTPNCDQPDCQLVLKNFTKQVHSFSSNPPGVLPHPKDLACFAMFEKSLLEETQHVSDSSQVMSIQNYPKTYPKTYPKRPTTSTEFPFFRQSTTALPWTPRLPSVRWRTRRAPSWSSCGCQGELIGENWVIFGLLSSANSKKMTPINTARWCRVVS